MLVTLHSFAALAQIPAEDAGSFFADQPATTNQQIRAERKKERIANNALAKKVKQAIYKSKGLSDTEIVVFSTARTGEVILAGVIMEPSQEQKATSVASEVPGVSSVTSKLTLYEEGGQ